MSERAKVVLRDFAGGACVSGRRAGGGLGAKSGPCPALSYLVSARSGGPGRTQAGELVGRGGEVGEGGPLKDQTGGMGTKGDKSGGGPSAQ